MTRLRRIAGLAALAAGIGAAGHGAVWWWVTERIQYQAAAAIAAPPQPGWQAAAGPMRRAGWPWAAVVHIDAPVLSAPLAPGQVLRWQAERLTLTIALARPRTLLAELSGAQLVQAGATPPIDATAAVMRALVPLDPSADVPVTVEVEALRAASLAGAMSLARLDLAVGGRRSAQRGEPALSVVLSARDLVLPAGGWPLGPAVSRLAGEMVLTGPVPAMPDIATRAEAWRDGGGVLELRRIELAWGEVTLAGESFLRLDGQLQPVGQGSARLGGHGAALRALTAAGIMTPRGALAAGAMLGLMARPPAGGGAPVVEAPLSLRDRTLSLGPIPLARMPELIWRPPG